MYNHMLNLQVFSFNENCELFLKPVEQKDISGPDDSPILLFIAGMDDFFISSPFIKQLFFKWSKTNIAQLRLSSNPNYGFFTLKDDARDIEMALSHLIKMKRKIVLMGHSTGCQSIMYFLDKYIYEGYCHITTNKNTGNVKVNSDRSQSENNNMPNVKSISKETEEQLESSFCHHKDKNTPLNKVFFDYTDSSGLKYSYSLNTENGSMNPDCPGPKSTDNLDAENKFENSSSYRSEYDATEALNENQISDEAATVQNSSLIHSQNPNSSFGESDKRTFNCVLDCDTIKKYVQKCILLGPVSDRTSLSKPPIDVTISYKNNEMGLKNSSDLSITRNSVNIRNIPNPYERNLIIARNTPHARFLQGRSVIRSERYLDLYDKNGSDDIFSADLPINHFKQMNRLKIPLVFIHMKKDEYNTPDNSQMLCMVPCSNLKVLEGDHMLSHGVNELIQVLNREMNL